MSLESLVIRYPSLAWVTSVFSFLSGLFGWTFAWLTQHADSITKLVGLVAAIFGAMAGFWTWRIQRRTWRRGESNPPFSAD